jgi:lysophospholipase L1-like esterase
MSFKSQQKLLFIGDSITDAGRTNGRGLLGDGFVRIIHHLMMAAHPELRLELLNRGISGNTVRDLQKRWQRDAIDVHADWLIIMIGVNDVWRGFDGQPELAVGVAEYEHTLEQLLKAAQTAGMQLLLLEPFLVEPNLNDPMRLAVEAHAAAVGRIAARLSVALVQTQAAFDRVMAHYGAEALAEDRLHPSVLGQTLLAVELMRITGTMS